MVAVYQADERLGVVTVLDFIHFLDCIRIGGIAANAPYGVSGVEDDAAFSHHFHGVLDILFSCHDNDSLLVVLVLNLEWGRFAGPWREVR